MSDDHDIDGPPERPVPEERTAWPSPPTPPPVFVPPGESAPPRGEMPPPFGHQSADPPLDAAFAVDRRGADRWPAWYGLASFGIGLVGVWVIVGALALIYLGLGGSENDAAFLVVATILQGVVFAVAAVAVARWSGPVSAADFGLVRARFWPSLGKVAVVAVAYFVFLGLFASAVDLKPDDTPDQLGADEGMLGMVGFVFTAAIVAPLAEEFFFRGMVFRSLVNGLGVFWAALVSGALFGALHIDSLDNDRLLQIVPLAVLGVLFALLYAWSGTLYAAIALHATNNSLAVVAYAADHDSAFGVVIAAAAWALMMLVCVTGWRRTDPGAAQRSQGDRPVGPPTGPPMGPPAGPAEVHPPGPAGRPPAD